MDWSAANRRGFRVEELPGIFREATGVETRGDLGALALTLTSPSAGKVSAGL